jgi:formate dehydrogenase major subunit
MPGGTLFLHFCKTDAAAKLITDPAFDSFGKIPEFKYCAARPGRRAGDAQ